MSFKYFFYDWLGFNSYLFKFLNNSFRAEGYQLFFKIISYFFKIEFFAIYYATALIYFLYYFFSVNNGHHMFMRNFQKFLNIGICYASIGFLYAFMKFNINFVRPICEQRDFYSLVNIDDIRCKSSFPSGHTAIVFLIAYSLWSYQYYFLRVILCINVVLVMLSRVVTAMHYPADIFYSVIITVIVINITKILMHRFKKKFIVPIGKKLFLIMRNLEF